MKSPIRLVCIIVFFIVFSFYLFPIRSFATISSAISTPSVTPTFSPNDQSKSTLPTSQHLWAQTVMLDVLGAIGCQVAGVDAAFPRQLCIGANQRTNTYTQQTADNHGLIGLVSQGIILTYTPPAHTNEYFQELSSNFGLVKHAYASDCSTPNKTDPQTMNGVGYCQLYPLLKIWTVFRNLAYLGFVIVFILIGFAIMLRLKIKPQTVVSIQSQIPRVIIAIVLITFSYAIAGFLIDLMYVSIGIITQLAAQIDPIQSGPTTVENTLKNIQNDNPIDFVSSVIGLSDSAESTAHALGNAAGDIIGSLGTGGHIIATILGTLVGAKIGQAAGSAISIIGTFVGAGLGALAGPEGIPIGAVAGGAIGTTAGAGLGLLSGLEDPNGTVAFLGFALAVIVLFIAILVSLVRVWLILIRAYVSILLDVVFAPAWILLAVVPKSKFTFGSWLRDMIANLAVFPLVIGLFLIAKVFIDAFTAGYGTGTIFSPPLVGINSLNDAGHALSGIIALGFIFLAPTMLNMSRSMFGAPKTNVIQNTLAGIGMGARVGRGIWQQTGGQLIGVDKNGHARPFSSILADRRMDLAEQRVTSMKTLEDEREKARRGEEGARFGLRKSAQLAYYKTRQGLSNPFGRLTEYDRFKNDVRDSYNYIRDYQFRGVSQEALLKGESLKIFKNAVMNDTLRRVRQRIPGAALDTSATTQFEREFKRMAGPRVTLTDPPKEPTNGTATTQPPQTPSSSTS